MNISNLSGPRIVGGLDQGGAQSDLAIASLLQQIDALKASLLAVLNQLRAMQPPIKPLATAPATVQQAYAAALAAYNAQMQAMIEKFNDLQAKLVLAIARLMTALAAMAARSMQEAEKQRIARQNAEMAKSEIEAQASALANVKADVRAIQKNVVINGETLAFVALAQNLSPIGGRSQPLATNFATRTMTGGSSMPRASGLPPGF